MTVGAALQQAAAQLSHSSTSAVLDAQVLLGYVLGRSRAILVAHGADALSEAHQRVYQALIQRRAAGEPVAYLTGIQEFYGRPFHVDPRVLIPRPETEMLIDEALHVLKGRRRPRILDIGTGSGCIALTLALELASAEVVGTDRSGDALEVARYNAAALGAGVEWRCGYLFGALQQNGAVGVEKFDCIVSNPPYVDLARTDTSSPLSSGLQFEPTEALEPMDGNAFSTVAAIVEQSPMWLKPHGVLLVEIGYDQGNAAFDAAERAFGKGYSKILKDIAGHDRLLITTKPA